MKSCKCQSEVLTFSFYELKTNLCQLEMPMVDINVCAIFFEGEVASYYEELLNQTDKILTCQNYTEFFDKKQCESECITVTITNF